MASDAESPSAQLTADDDLSHIGTGRTASDPNGDDTDWTELHGVTAKQAARLTSELTNWPRYGVTL